MKNPLKKTIGSWFLFVWRFAPGIKDESNGRRLNAKLLIGMWIATIGGAFIATFSRHIFNIYAWYALIQGGSTGNFRSLSNPNTQIMIGLLVLGFFLAHIGSKHIKTPDTSQEKPSVKRFLVFMFFYAWAVTSLLLAGSPYGLFVVIIDIVILTYFYIKKDVELCLTTQSRGPPWKH